jgi:hypothetical protein
VTGYNRPGTWRPELYCVADDTTVLLKTARYPPICSAVPFVIWPDSCVQVRSIWRLFGRRTRPHMLN